MQNKIVHYIHFDKLWYYWVDEYEERKYWRKLDGRLDSINLLTEEIITEHQCRNKLLLLFPDYKIMKAIPYHYSPSHDGSRPVKITNDRKRRLKEKVSFKKELERFIE